MKCNDWKLSLNFVIYMESGTLIVKHFQTKSQHGSTEHDDRAVTEEKHVSSKSSEVKLKALPLKV